MLTNVSTFLAAGLWARVASALGESEADLDALSRRDVPAVVALPWVRTLPIALLHLARMTRRCRCRRSSSLSAASSLVLLLFLLLLRMTIVPHLHRVAVLDVLEHREIGRRRPRT